MAKHPIIDMDCTKTVSIAILDGKSFTGNITELGFEKVYYFNGGVLSKWTKREDLPPKDKIPVIILPTNTDSNKFDKELFDNSIKAIEDNEKIIEANIVNKELEDEIFINELVIECFERHSEEVSETILELKDFVEKPNKK